MKFTRNDRPSLYLTLMGVGISGVLAAAYVLSPLASDIYRGEFERNLIEVSSVNNGRILDLKYENYYIAGVYDGTIFLGNKSAPFHLLSTNFTLTDTQHIRIRAQEFYNRKISDIALFRTVLEPPYFFVSHGVSPTILRGRIGEWEANVVMPDTGYYFVEAVPMSLSSFAIRSYSPLHEAYELGRMTTDSLSLYFNYDLLEKQIDGIFCSEGMLHYSHELNSIVYLYSYRNEYSVADTNMNLRHRGRTIDPFKRALIGAMRVDSDGTHMLASPPLRINERSCLDGKFLYVQSNVLDKNGDIERFVGGSVVDVYDVTQVGGDYLYSFYLDSFEDRKVSDFGVVDGQVVCIYGSALRIIELPEHSQNGGQLQ